MGRKYMPRSACPLTRIALRALSVANNELQYTWKKKISTTPSLHAQFVRTSAQREIEKHVYVCVGKDEDLHRSKLETSWVPKVSDYSQ